MSDTLEASYHNDQVEKRKITNAYKGFFLSELACLRPDALSSNGGVLIAQPTANFSDVTVWPLKSLLNSVGGVESIFSIFGIPDLPISYGLFPYKERIKQPRLRQHGAKISQKKCIRALSNKFLSLLFHFVQVNCQMLVNVFFFFFFFLVFNSKVMYLNVGKGKTIVF